MEEESRMPSLTPSLSPNEWDPTVTSSRAPRPTYGPPAPRRGPPEPYSGHGALIALGIAQNQSAASKAGAALAAKRHHGRTAGVRSGRCSRSSPRPCPGAARSSYCPATTCLPGRPRPRRRVDPGRRLERRRRVCPRRRRLRLSPPRRRSSGTNPLRRPARRQAP